MSAVSTATPRDTVVVERTSVGAALVGGMFNAQPWRWRVDGRRLELHADRTCSVRKTDAPAATS